MARKKRRPLVPPPMKSLGRARAVTSAYHAALRAAAAASTPAARAAARAALAAVPTELYQAASALTTSKNGASASFVFSQMTALGLRPRAGAPRPRVLEIGAINTRLLACPWLDVDAIDLVASAPGVRQCDFFDAAPARSFTAVVCAMVLNCVPTPAARGVMLARMAAHLRPGGVAFIVLPRRCVEAAGSETYASFEAAAAAAGLAPVLARRSSPKLAFWAVRGAEDGEGGGGEGAASSIKHGTAAAADTALFRVDAAAAAAERARLAEREDA